MKYTIFTNTIKNKSNMSKKIFFTISIMLFGLIIVKAQDTMYVHQKTGGIIKIAVNNVDSVVFYAKATPAGSTVTDKDGNVYNTVTIGTQTWMKENLKTITYNDGTPIQLVTDNTAWSNLITPAYSNYNNTTNADTINTYGRLYNWYTVNTNKLCPTGWHVPSDAEWTTLENYLIANGYNYDGTTTGNKYAKSLAATTNWLSYTGVGTVGNTDYPAKRNATGFTALPGGYRSYNGTFIYIGNYGTWWSSSEGNTYNAWFRAMTYNYSSVYRNYLDKQDGFSVRCLGD